jgi:hypothetical protein
VNTLDGLSRPVRDRLPEAARPQPQTPRERFLAAASALRQAIDESIRACKERSVDAVRAAVASHAPAASRFLQRAPPPGRIRELSEAPEKALVAGAAAAMSTALPVAQPVFGVSARVVEKAIDRAREPDDGGRPR